MADEDITLDGKPLHSLRVADLKAALEQRNLPKSGQKNTLIKRLKGALMLENLQKTSSSHSGLQPNSQIGEEMCQNSFIKQYLAKQQELLRQRLEREAQQEEDADESPALPEEDEDHSEDNDNSSYVSDKAHQVLARPEERAAGGSVTGHDAPGARMQRAFHQGHKEPPAPSPPRAVASLSVRVLGQPECPPAVPPAQEKEGTAPGEPGSAHPVLHLSRSAGGSASSHVHEDSDEGDDGDDESDDDEDWGPGPGPGPGGARKGNRGPPPPQQLPPSVPSSAGRSKRKLQPPQHIPPPQVHHTPMQLRHPTPPPSPPPNLFPLPDTPKQSPPDDREEAVRGQRVVPFPPSTLQSQDSDSSSRSSSPEPPVKRGPGPLSRLVHKMESEGAFRTDAGMSGETAHSTAESSSESPQQGPKTKPQEEGRKMEEERQLKEREEKERKQEQESERRKAEEQEKEKKRLEEEKEQERKRIEEAKKQLQKEEQEKEKKQEEKRGEEKQLKEQQEKKKQMAKKGRVVVTEVQDSGSSSESDSKSDSSSRSSRSSSSQDKTQQLKKVDQEGEDGKGAETRCLSKRRSQSFDDSMAACAAIHKLATAEVHVEI